MIKKSPIVLICSSSRYHINLLFSNLKNYIPGLTLKNSKNYQFFFFNHPRDVLLFYELLNFFDSNFKDYFKNWELSKEKQQISLFDANLEVLDDNFQECFDDVSEELQPLTPTKRKKLHIKYKTLPRSFQFRPYFKNWTLNQFQTHCIVYNVLIENRVLITEKMFQNFLDLYNNSIFLQKFRINFLFSFFWNYLTLLQYLFFINWMNKLFYLKLSDVKFKAKR